MARFGLACAWLAPLLVVIELVGSAVEQSLTTTFGLLALFLAALWLPMAPDPEELRAPGRWRRGAGALLVLAGGALLAFGIWRILEPARFPPATLPRWMREHPALVLVPVLGAWPAALGIPWLFGRKLAGRDLERAGLLVALVFLALLHAKTRVQGLFVLPYAKPWLPTLLAVVAALVALIAFVPRLPPLARILGLIAAAVVLRAVGLETWKLDPATRDMLPLVQSAQDAFAAGHNPYDLHQMQRGSQVPLTYLPGMWLLHGVPRLFGLDLRWTGIVADAAVAAGLWWAASGVERSRRGRARGLALGFSAAWMFSPSVHWNGLYAEPHAWWLVLAALLAATLRKKWWLAAGVLGVALATRHFALIVAPFVVLAMWRSIGWRQTLPRLGLAGAIAAVLLVPFVLRDPETFWFGTYRWLVEYGPAHQSWFWFKFGFSGPLYKANAAAWMPRAQIAIVVAMLALAAPLRGTRAFVGPAGTAYVGFVMFNGIVWDSFYLGAALFPAFAGAAAHAAAPEASRELRPLSRRALAIGGAALTLSAICGISLIFSLLRSHDRSGIGALRAELSREARPAHAIVDRSDWRLAFVKGKPLFDGPAPRARVGSSVFDPRFGAFGALDAERVWVVTRAARDDALRDTLGRVGSATTTRFGRFALTRLEPARVTARLSESVAKLAPSFDAEPLIQKANRWVSTSVTYVEVLPRPCRVGGGVRPMIFAHPATGGELRLRFDDVALGKTLVVLGGIEDPVALWGKAPVDVGVRIDGQPAGSLRLPSAAGVEWTPLDTAAHAGQSHSVELVLTTSDDAQRMSCVDALVLE